MGRKGAGFQGPPGIALDYDGVIANTNTVKSRWIRRHLGLDVPPWETDRTNCLRRIGKEAYLRMSPEAYGWRASLAAPPVPGVRRALRALARHARVWVVTARSGTMLRGCRAWMRRRGLDRFIAGYKVGGRADGTGEGKAALCARSGIMALVDDDERHFSGLEKIPILKVLFKNGARGRVRVPPGARLFTRWADLLPWLLRRLEEAPARRRDRPRRAGRGAPRPPGTLRRKGAGRAALRPA